MKLNPFKPYVPNRSERPEAVPDALDVRSEDPTPSAIRRSVRKRSQP